VRWFIDSVRVRLTVTVSLIFAGALCAAAYGLVQQVEGALVSDVQTRNDDVAKALARVLSSSVVDPALLNDPSQLSVSLGDAVQEDAVRDTLTQSFVYVQGPGSASVASANGLFDRLRRFFSGEAVPLFGKVLPSRIDSEQYVVSQVNVQSPQGPMTLSVASSLEPIRRTVDRVANSLVFAVPSMVGAVALLAWFMTGRALRPVSAITGRVQEITGSTLDQRVPEPETEDEIADLARTMNAMLDRLESAADAQRRFMSDASHELRSPVTSIRAQLETALLRPESTNWTEVGQTVLAEDERLGALVDNLLALSRLEEGVRRPTSEVDLDEIVHDQLIRSFRVSINRSEVLAGRVIGVRDELTSVVRNLIDNAARHASTQIKVSLNTRGRTVRFTAEDDGPGIPIDQREKVFERFTRLQEGRSRDAGGSGLGLALTRRIVETHGGRVFIETSELGGASFVVELPAIDEDDL
jgi:signal transduction histidine kinase